MIATIRHRTLLPLMVMLIALAGMTLSTIGEASSHGIAELTGLDVTDHGDHSHSHSLEDRSESSHGSHQHHDSGNHTHETADRLTITLTPAQVISHGNPCLSPEPRPRIFVIAWNALQNPL